MKKDNNFVTLSKLKERGWTTALVKRFLGEPDELRANPHFRSGPKMKLYNRQRVDEVEASEEYRDAQESRRGRQAAVQKSLDTKRRQIEEYVARVKIEVPELSEDELIRRACDNYNYHSSGNNENWASPTSDREFLDRICVNYLRHCLTKYETHLAEIAGKVGVRNAYLEIKTKVLEAIGETYDWLWVECSRQEDRMRGEETLRESWSI